LFRGIGATWRTDARKQYGLINPVHNSIRWNACVQEQIDNIDIGHVKGVFNVFLLKSGLMPYSQAIKLSNRKPRIQIGNRNNKKLIRQALHQPIDPDVVTVAD